MTPATSVRAAIAPWVLGSIVVAVVVLVVVLVAGGGAPQVAPGGLPDAGQLVGWALPVVRLLVDLTGIVTVGLMLAASRVLRPEPATASSARAAARWLAAVWAVLALLQAGLQVAELRAISLPTDLSTLGELVSAVGQSPESRAMLVQAALAASVVWLAWPAPRTGEPRAAEPSAAEPSAAEPRAVGSGAVRAAVGLGLALAAFVPPGLTGHAVTGNRLIGSASLIVHLVAAALWVGGLAALGWLAVRGRGPLADAVPRFSRLALGCLIAVALSGVVNAVVRIGTFDALFGTAYGVVVIAKVTAILLLAGFGWVHRQRTVDRLRSAWGQRDASGGVLVFLGLASVELAVMVATVGLAVGLSQTPTPPTADGQASPGPGMSSDTEFAAPSVQSPRT